MDNKRLFLFAGEHSGDLHGSHLMHSIKGLNSNLSLEGVGGPLMRQEGLDAILLMEEFEVMGFQDIVLSLGKLMGQFRKVRDYILHSKPAAVVFIDYPGFNIRMAGQLRRKGYKGKLIHYVSPTVWAWGKGRIKKMERTLDLLMSILPFEVECYRNSHLPVSYVGNPTVEGIHNYQYDTRWKEKVGLEVKGQLLALFPGSRRSELEKGLKKQVETLNHILNKHHDITFAISCARPEHKKTIEAILKDTHIPATIVPVEYSYELMREATAAIATSGTVTLELALHHTPTVVTYEVKGLNRFIAKHILRVNLPYYCLVNILGKREIFPEFMEKPYTPETLYDALVPLMKQGSRRQKCLEGCRHIENLLGESTASQQAARKIVEILA